MIVWGQAELNLADPKQAAKRVREAQADVIINAAAFTDVDGAEDQRETAMAVNCHGPGAMAGVAAETGACLIHVSTDYVFDGNKTRPYREDDLTNPVNVYGESKRAGELAVLGAHPQSVVLRTSWLFSGSGRNFLTTMARLADSEGPLRVVNDQVGQPTSASDLARAIVLIVQDLTTRPRPELYGIFHAAGVDRTNWYEFAVAIMKKLGSRVGRVPRVEPITSLEFPTRARRPLNSQLDVSRLKQVYGISIPGWTESMGGAIDEYLESKLRSQRQ